MAIDIMKSSVAVGVGVVDEVFEWWDEKAGRTQPFRRWSDIARLIGAGAGYAIQVFWPRQERMGEALALSATPLLVKSIAKPIRGAIGQPAGHQVQFTPRRSYAGAGTVAQYPARAREEEFEGIRLR